MCQNVFVLRVLAAPQAAVRGRRAHARLAERQVVHGDPVERALVERVAVRKRVSRGYGRVFASSGALVFANVPRRERQARGASQVTRVPRVRVRQGVALAETRAGGVLDPLVDEHTRAGGGNDGRERTSIARAGRSTERGHAFTRTTRRCVGRGEGGSRRRGAAYVPVSVPVVGEPYARPQSSSPFLGNHLHRVGARGVREEKCVALAAKETLLARFMRRHSTYDSYVPRVDGKGRGLTDTPSFQSVVSAQAFAERASRIAWKVGSRTRGPESQVRCPRGSMRGPAVRHPSRPKRECRTQFQSVGTASQTTKSVVPCAFRGLTTAGERETRVRRPFLLGAQSLTVSLALFPSLDSQAPRARRAPPPPRCLSGGPSDFSGPARGRSSSARCWTITPRTSITR